MIAMIVIMIIMTRVIELIIIMMVMIIVMIIIVITIIIMITDNILASTCIKFISTMTSKSFSRNCSINRCNNMIKSEPYAISTDRLSGASK
jgi:hypothetical protein